MKALIIYSSAFHGNTEKIAKEINKTLQGDLIKVNDYREGMLAQYDLIGFGSGIFYGKHHESLINLAQSMNLEGKSAFVFSTSGSGQTKYNNTLADLLKSKGAKLVGEFACRGYNTYGFFKWIGGIGKGRPNEGDLFNAKQFAKNLI